MELPDAQLPLPRFAVGTASLRIDEAPRALEQIRELFCIAIAAGMNWIDTAPLYGQGKIEAAVGKALRDLPRNSYRISTKTGYVMNECAIAALSEGDPRTKTYPPRNFSYDFTATSLERSFAMLQTQILDAVFLHDPTAADKADIEAGALRVLQRLKRDGAVRNIGIGLSDISAALHLIENLQLDLIMLAGGYTLLVRDAGERLLERCRELEIDVLAAGALNSGILADPFAPSPRFNYAAAPIEIVSRARELDAICRAAHVPLRAAALQFPLRHPAIRTVVTGPASAAELRDVIEMISYPVPLALWATLESAGERI